MMLYKTIMFGLVHPRGLLEVDKGVRCRIAKLMRRTFETKSALVSAIIWNHDPLMQSLTDPLSANVAFLRGIHNRDTRVTMNTIPGMKLRKRRAIALQ